MTPWVAAAAQVHARLRQGLADVVFSDMAPNTCGNGQTDHFRIMELCRSALHFA
jgi:23S rRNA U2552 (ribose-2'-O)-methylase RlmE/FtsJ